MNGSRSGRYLFARSGFFLKVPNLVDIFLPDLVSLWMVPDLVDIFLPDLVPFSTKSGRYLSAKSGSFLNGSRSG